MIRLALALSLVASAATIDPAYRAEVGAWRQKREARLRSEQGWLAVSGLFWLKPGRNVLPSPYDKVGWFELDGGKTIAHVSGATKELKDDDDDTAIESGRYIFELHASGERFAIRVWDRENPKRNSYPPLRWYAVDPAYRIQAKFVAYDPPKELLVVNITGDQEKALIPGYAQFELKGRTIRLVGWEENSKFFIVFRDKTSGKETYPTARFLVADLPKDGAVVIDFNKAYNPPCAFSHYATCPLPPAGNSLPIAIDAGEKMPPLRH